MKKCLISAIFIMSIIILSPVYASNQSTVPPSNDSLPESSQGVVLPQPAPQNAFSCTLISFGYTIKIFRRNLPQGMNRFSKAFVMNIGNVSAQEVVDAFKDFTTPTNGRRGPTIDVYDDDSGMLFHSKAPNAVTILLLDDSDQILGYQTITKEHYIIDQWHMPSAFMEKAKEYSSQRGNTSGNISNFGIAAASGDWIYYRNQADGGCLYKEKLNSGNKTKITQMAVKDIRIFGDYIFFTSNKKDIGGSTNGLYCVKADGTNEILVTKEFLLNPQFTGDCIYFNETDKIRKINLDGTNNSLLVTDSGINLQYNAGYIYFTRVEKGQSAGLYRIRPDGTDKAALLDVCGFYNIVGNEIYYTNQNWGGNIYKCKLDGSGKTVVSKDKCNYINVDGNWIYYSNLSDGEKLYKIKKDGTKKTKLNNQQSRTINVAGNWIFYDEKPGRGTCDIYRIKKDGTGRTRTGN